MPLHERDILHFIDVPLAYLNKITGNEIVARDPTIEFQSLVFSASTILVSLSGAAEGFFYLTASQPFLQHIHTARHHRGWITENGREVMGDIGIGLLQALQPGLAAGLHLSKPWVFSTVPDDPIEMPPAVFVQPLFWRKEHAYLVIGISSPETP